MAYELGKLVKADSTLNTAVQNALSIGEKLSPDNRPRIQRNSMMESDGYVPFTFFEISVGENNSVTVGEGCCYYNLVSLNIKEKKNALTLNKGGYLCLKVDDADANMTSYVIEDDIPSMPVDGSKTVKFPIGKVEEIVTENNNGNGENSGNGANQEQKKSYSVTQFMICNPPHLFAFGTCDTAKKEGESNAVDQ